MFMYVFSIVLIVLSSVIYNVCQKSTPQNVNPLAAMFVTYLTAGILSVIIFIFYRTEKGFLESIKEINWTNIVLGFSILGLEMGFLLAYRAGWNISIGATVANILLSVILIPLGVLFFKESFSLNKIFGIVFCIIGLILINKK